MQNLIYLFMSFMIYSFLGFIVETIYVWILDKKFQNRGFLIGPVLPIYGFGCILITLLLSPYKAHPIILFCMSIIICSVLEYLTSYLLEKIFNARWWDYSNRKYNINGRICLETLIPFGIGGSIICYLVDPNIQKLIRLVPYNIVIIISIVLAILMITDTLLSIKTISSVKNKIKKGIRDNTIEIKEKVKDFIISNSKLRKRFINSYPNILEKIKDVLEKSKISIKK